MLVCPLDNIQTNRLRAVFPHQIRPPFSATDFLGEYGITGLPHIGDDGEVYATSEEGWSPQTIPGIGRMEYDPVVKAIYPRALFVLHDQRIDAAGVASGSLPALGRNLNPHVSWDVTTPANGAATTKRINFDYDRLTVKLKGQDHGDFTAFGRAWVSAQGFTAFVDSVNVGHDKTVLVAWRVSGARGVFTWYGVQYGADGGMLLVNRNTDGTGRPTEGRWRRVDRLKIGDERAAVLDPGARGFAVSQDLPGAQIRSGQPIVLEVRLIAGKMRVTLGSEDTPLLWPHPQSSDSTGEPDDQIDRYWVAVNNCRECHFSIHPTKFTPKAALVSGEINFGFDPLPGQIAGTTFRTHFAPNKGTTPERADATKVGWRPAGTDSNVVIHDINGTSLRYCLTIDNGAATTSDGAFSGRYVNRTAAVYAVSLDTPGVSYSIINPPASLGAVGQPPMPSVVRVSHQFNLETLTISSSASMDFDNFTGIWTNAYGSGVLDNKGHIAVAMDFGTLGWGTRREFTGIGNTSFQNNWNGQGRDIVTMQCADCWRMLDVPVWNLAWLDGWNIYAVMAYLAAIGGITASQLGFASLVPSNPYAPSPGLPPAAQQFMGTGPAGAPLTRFGGGQKIESIMRQIAQSIGFMLYFDVFGVLQFHKFEIPTGVAKVFSHVAGDALTGGLGLDEIMTGSYSSSLDEVRNSVTVIGVNAFGPIWEPVVAHAIDLASIFDDSVANFKGFNAPMVWADNMFANLAFADSAASSMLAFMRIPDKSVRFRTWYPTSAVYPGDIIRVFYPRSAASLFNFFVTETHTTRGKGMMPTMDIVARLVPGSF